LYAYIAAVPNEVWANSAAGKNQALKALKGPFNWTLLWQPKVAAADVLTSGDATILLLNLEFLPNTFPKDAGGAVNLFLPRMETHHDRKVQYGGWENCYRLTIRP
jgi:hypothetical protein